MGTFRIQLKIKLLEVFVKRAGACICLTPEGLFVVLQVIVKAVRKRHVFSRQVWEPSASRPPVSDHELRALLDPCLSLENR